MRKQIGLKLDVAQIDALDAAAKAKGLNRTEAVEQAIAEWMDSPAPKRPAPAPRPPVSERQAQARRAMESVQLGFTPPAPGSRLKKR